MKFIILSFLSFFIVGCAHERIVYKDVPVVVHEDIPAPAKVVPPNYALKKINESSSPKDVVKAYDIQITQMQSYIDQLLKSLEPYKKAAKK